MLRRSQTNRIFIATRFCCFQSPFIVFPASQKNNKSPSIFLQQEQQIIILPKQYSAHINISSSSNNNNNNTMTAVPPALTLDVLKHQDDKTSAAVIRALKDSAKFEALSAKEGRDLISRDDEDEEKLKKGIEISFKKGVLKPLGNHLEPTHKVNVHGKSADQVADEIFAQLPHGAGETSVLILQGLSGTGKGTTVAKLKLRLPKCICWSNGNVFRAVTMLANEALNNAELTAENLTPDLLKGIFGRLSFKPFGDQFDVVIDDTIRVSTIANTTLKQPLVSNRVPTVAEQTQGEVVMFAADAIKTLKAAGHNVILEGRAQTLNHIRTPYRFELVIPEVSILGMRRAAQRVMAWALETCKVKKGPDGGDATENEIATWCKEAVEALK